MDHKICIMNKTIGMNLQSFLLVVAIGFFAVACGGKQKAQGTQLLDPSTFQLTEMTQDSTYGHTQNNPIKVGGAADQQGPSNERRFLNALAGPNGEKISYERSGSCCPFETKSGFLGKGLLDLYEVTWKGIEEPVILYINMYDAETLKAPVGFTIKALKNI